MDFRFDTGCFSLRRCFVELCVIRPVLAVDVDVAGIRCIYGFYDGSAVVSSGHFYGSVSLSGIYFHGNLNIFRRLFYRVETDLAGLDFLIVV